MADIDIFSIYLNYGGKFIIIDGKEEYLGGELQPWHGIDVDRFGYLDLKDEVEKLGYNTWDRLVFKIPRVGTGFRDIHDDSGVMEMLKHVSKGTGFINVFVDGGKMTTEAPATVETSEIDKDDEEWKSVDVDSAVEEGCNEVENEFCQLDEDSDTEDQDYNQVGESDTDDGLSDNELASDDEEYIEARQNKAKYRNYVPVDEVADRLHMVGGFRFNNSQFVDDENKDETESDREMHSDYRDSDGDINSDSTSSDDAVDVGSSSRRMKNRVTYDPKCDHKTLTFVLGMRFENAHQCRSAVQRQAIMNGYNIQVMRSNKNQFEARCVMGCPWRLYGSTIHRDKSFAIKSYEGVHRCHREMNNRQATSTWIAKEYVNRFRRNPNWTIKNLEEDIIDKYALSLSKWKLYRAKWKALEMLRGSMYDHYACLRSYMAELLRVDKEGRFEFLLDDDSVFKAFFMGFSALKKGFLKGCRPIIGFDGCFLKTFIGGALLCATGKDGNNQMYPVAWAVVEAENESCWTWFLTILFEELGITDGLGWTFISDQQKGLINAIRELAPHAEHRNCARHVYCNWKKEFKGQTLKNFFWRVARSTYEGEYKSALDELKAENEAAYQNFLERDPQKLCKIFISTLPRCDMIDNNVSETFNGYIVKARGRPISDMLEDIRAALMERQHTKLMQMSGVNDIICPRIRAKLEQHKYNSRLCHTKPAVGDKFQVAIGEDRFVVNLNYNTCTCRCWDMTGIPCIHAYSAIHFMKKDPADFVHYFFTIENYIGTYQYALDPLNGRKMWPEAAGNPIKPPPYRKMPGRPKKKRRRAPEEEPKSANKLKRTGIQMTCQKCLRVGHNLRTCTNDPVERPPKGIVKRGRPPKARPQPNASNSEVTSGQTIATRTNTQISIRATHKMTTRNRVMQPSSSSKLTPQSTSVHAKERALVRSGYGVRIFEGTGNIYMRMPTEKRVHTVKKNIVAQSASANNPETVSSYSKGGRGGKASRGGRAGRGGRYDRGGISASATSNEKGNNIRTQESTIA